MMILYVKINGTNPTIKIETNAEIIVNHIRIIYGRYIYPNCESNNDCFAIKIMKCDDRYLVSFGSKEICLVEEELPQIIERIFMNICKSNADIYNVHAACVRYLNHAFAFMGKSGTGKSTLTSYLYKKGMIFVSDDKISIDLKHEITYSCGRPIFLREDVLNLFQNEEKKIYKIGKYKRSVIEPQFYQFQISSIPIFFQLYRRKKYFEIYTPDIIEKIDIIQNNMIFFQDVKNLKLIAECARKFKIYVVHYTNVEDIEKLIRRKEKWN